jgi:hypothetical protein
LGEIIIFVYSCLSPGKWVVGGGNAVQKEVFHLASKGSAKAAARLLGDMGKGHATSMLLTAR